MYQIRICDIWVEKEHDVTALKTVPFRLLLRPHVDLLVQYEMRPDPQCPSCPHPPAFPYVRDDIGQIVKRRILTGEEYSTATAYSTGHITLREHGQLKEFGENEWTTLQEQIAQRSPHPEVGGEVILALDVYIDNATMYRGYDPKDTDWLQVAVLTYEKMNGSSGIAYRIPQIPTMQMAFACSEDKIDPRIVTKLVQTHHASQLISVFGNYRLDVKDCKRNGKTFLVYFERYEQ